MEDEENRKQKEEEEEEQNNPMKVQYLLNWRICWKKGSDSRSESV